MAEKKIKITLIRSICGTKPNQRKTAVALGLKKIRTSVVKEGRPEIMGMMRTIAHLVTVEEIKQ